MNEKHDSKTKSRGAVCGSIRMHGSVGASGEQSPDATRSIHVNNLQSDCLSRADNRFFCIQVLQCNVLLFVSFP